MQLDLAEGNGHHPFENRLSFSKAIWHQKNVSFYELCFEELRDFKIENRKAEASRFLSVDVHSQGSREFSRFQTVTKISSFDQTDSKLETKFNFADTHKNQ